jgi:hypothetical protein
VSGRRQAIQNAPRRSANFQPSAVRVKRSTKTPGTGMPACAMAPSAGLPADDVDQDVAADMEGHGIGRALAKGGQDCLAATDGLVRRRRAVQHRVVREQRGQLVEAALVVQVGVTRYQGAAGALYCQFVLHVHGFFLRFTRIVQAGPATHAVQRAPRRVAPSSTYGHSRGPGAASRPAPARPCGDDAPAGSSHHPCRTG